VAEVAEGWARRDSLVDDARGWLDGAGDTLGGGWGEALGWARTELDLV